VLTKQAIVIFELREKKTKDAENLFDSSPFIFIFTFIFTLTFISTHPVLAGLLTLSHPYHALKEAKNISQSLRKTSVEQPLVMSRIDGELAVSGWLATKERLFTRLVSKQNKTKQKIQNMPLFLSDMAGLIKTSKQTSKQARRAQRELEWGNDSSSSSSSSSR